MIQPHAVLTFVLVLLVASLALAEIVALVRHLAARRRFPVALPGYPIRLSAEPHPATLKVLARAVALGLIPPGGLWVRISAPHPVGVTRGPAVRLGGLRPVIVDVEDRQGDRGGALALAIVIARDVAGQPDLGAVLQGALARRQPAAWSEGMTAGGALRTIEAFRLGEFDDAVSRRRAPQTETEVALVIDPGPRLSGEELQDGLRRLAAREAACG